MTILQRLELKSVFGVLTFQLFCVCQSLALRTLCSTDHLSICEAPQIQCPISSSCNSFTVVRQDETGADFNYTIDNTQRSQPSVFIEVGGEYRRLYEEDDVLATWPPSNIYYIVYRCSSNPAAACYVSRGIPGVSYERESWSVRIRPESGFLVNYGDQCSFYGCYHYCNEEACQQVLKVLPHRNLTILGSCSDNLGSDMENGNVTYSQPLLEQGRYLENTTANVSCSEGYTGGGAITCQTNGNWSSTSLPSCQLVDCGNPPRLESGALAMPANTTYGSTITYICNEDHVFSEVSSEIRTCLASGLWSDEDIKCLATCPNLGSAVENGNVTYSQPLLEQGRYLENTIATVSCTTEGYTGGGVITCQTNGNWSSTTLPGCAVVNCSDPPMLENGDFSVPSSTTYNSTVTYECNEDYVFSTVSTHTRTCCADGNWSDEVIECLECSNVTMCSGNEECRVMNGNATCISTVKGCPVRYILPPLLIVPSLLLFLCTVYLLWRKYKRYQADEFKHFRYYFECHVQREELDPYYTPVDVCPDKKMSVSLSIQTLDVPMYESPIKRPADNPGFTNVPGELHDAMTPMHMSTTESPNQSDAMFPPKLEETTTDTLCPGAPSKNVEGDLATSPTGETEHFLDINGTSNPSGDEPTVDTPKSLNTGHSENTETQLLSESPNLFPPENHAISATSNAITTKDQFPTGRDNDIIACESESRRAIQCIQCAATSEPQPIVTGSSKGCSSLNTLHAKILSGSNTAVANNTSSSTDNITSTDYACESETISSTASTLSDTTTIHTKTEPTAGSSVAAPAAVTAEWSPADLSLPGSCSHDNTSGSSRYISENEIVQYCHIQLKNDNSSINPC